MSLTHAHFVISMTLLATVIGITALECDKQTACSCHLPDGSSYDLTKLSAIGPFSEVSINYAWSFQPCKDVNMMFDTNNRINGECNNSTGVSLCLKSLSPELLPFSLGNTRETKWDVTDVQEPRLILKHGPRTTDIILICCASCATKFSMNTATASKFTYTMVSPLVCKVPAPSEGLSTGSLLVILLFVFSGVYLLIGALALRFFRGAIGWELIPNYDFWSDLPALVRDGVAFTFSGCSADSYDRI